MLVPTSGSVPKNHDDDAQTASRNPKTVLLVDDDDQLRTFCRECLAENGFMVLEGDNGFEALLVAASHGGPIDVLITDLEMPRIRGNDLAHVFKALWPTMSVLIISGSEPMADFDSDCAFLPKPFVPDALLKTVGKVLEAHSVPRPGTIS